MSDRWAPRARLGLRDLLFRRDVDDAIDEELRFHVEARADQLARDGGLSPEAANNESLRRFGDLDQYRARCRATERKRMRRGRMRSRVESLVHDVRFAVRGAARQPGFTTVVVGTLALAVGAITAIFSVVSGVVLAPLPYDDPDGIMIVWEENLSRGNPTNTVSPANYHAWFEAESFAEIGAFVPFSATLTGDGEPERVGVVRAAPTFFSILGAQAHIGRLFAPGEEGSDARVAVLDHGFWQRRFGGEPVVIGRSITLDGDLYEVVGVLPAAFDFEPPQAFNSTGTEDVWLPVVTNPTWRGRFLQVLGRLAPGVSREQADAELDVIAARYEEEAPDYNAGYGVNVVPLYQQIVGDSRTLILILFSAVGIVLLIAAANVANLLLARATRREREMAVRAAIGARGGRLLRLLLVESLFLGLAGGLLGVAVAVWAVRLLVALGPDIPRLGEVGVDGSVLAFAFTVSVLTALLFGTLPALRAARPDFGAGLKEGGARGGSRRGTVRTRHALVAAEVAMSLTLLVGAGLLLRSFKSLLDEGVGLEVDRVLTLDLQLGDDAYSDSTRGPFFEELVDRIAMQPGVEAASAITALPLSGMGIGTTFFDPDRPLPEAAERPVADIRPVHRDYHETMGIPLLAGRLFSALDGADAPTAVVISEATAEEVFGGLDPLGRRIAMPWGDTLVAEVIGVVADVRHDGPGTTTRSKLYWDHRQFADFSFMTLVVRTTGDPASVLPAVRREVHALDPDLPLYNVRTMESYLSDSVARNRFALLAFAAFAAVALVLSVVGVYGVLSYAVSLRTREIGIRVALGAGGDAIGSMVLRQGAIVAVVGLFVGLAGAVILTRFLGSLLYGVTPTDPLTLALVTALLFGTALAASWIPARRAASTDPASVLRGE
ncbi:MAG: ABC transporter permease [marine benthic group bacterium]|nr:ABC transporter permease [Candidatus Benthicola marisminoris]